MPAGFCLQAYLKSHIHVGVEVRSRDNVGVVLRGDTHQIYSLVSVILTWVVSLIRTNTLL